MQRLGISKEEVPTNVHVINMPISERYKIEVFIASSLGVILLLALIGYLFISIGGKQDEGKRCSLI